MDNKTLRSIADHPEVIKPFGNYICVDIMKPQEESFGGVLLPDQVKDNDKQMLARVISVGPGVRSLLTGEFMPLQCKEGDLVVILRHAPVEVKLAGKVTHIIFEGDILGKIDETKLGDIQAQEPEKPETEAYEVSEEVKAEVKELPSGLFVVNSNG